jgi:hypothetical protein
MTVPTVVIMQKKKTARTTSENEGDETGPYIKERLIDAGYTYPEQCIDELLELAGADNGPESRTDLLNALQLAQMTYEEEEELSCRERPSSKQIQQLEDSIEKTRMLLTRIRGYDDFRNIGFITLPVGRGAVGVAMTEDMIRGRMLELPRNPSITDGELMLPTLDGMAAAINIEPLLRATLLYARGRRRGRGGPKNLGKEAVLFYAEGFFRKHSPTKPSTGPKNPFHEFAERFYEAVSKTEPGSLDRQMRNVFAANTNPHIE